MDDHSRAETLLELRGVSSYFRIGGFGSRGIVRALDGVNLKVHDGEFIGIAGESGCGKTTLARLICGLLRPTAGEIIFSGRDISTLRGRDHQAFRRDVQMVFQDPDGSLSPRRRIGKTLRQPLDVHKVGTEAYRQQRVNELLEQVNLVPADYYLGKFPYELSGGAKQRVAIARALALNPRLIVADEPVASLDMSIRGTILTLLRRMNRELGIAILLISHDLHVLKALTDMVAVIYLGRFAEIGRTANIFARPRHPYTIALTSVTPVVDPDGGRNRRRLPLVGDPPSAANPPPGCSFHTRCPYAVDCCRVERPELTQVSFEHRVACHEWEHVARGDRRVDDPGGGATSERAN